MSDSAARSVSIAITPMHRGDAGTWESGPREGAGFYLVELVEGEGEDAEVIVECRDAHTAALAARVAAATLAALGLGTADEDGTETVPAFDEDTAALLNDTPTPEVEMPAGEWREEDEADESEERSGGRGR
jgi:hypothetical protein